MISQLLAIDMPDKMRIVSLALNNLYVYYCDIQQFNIDMEVLYEGLNLTDRKRFKGFKNASRRYQFVMARWLVKQCLNQLFDQNTSHDYQLINYSRWEVTEQEKSYSVSISHSGHYVAIAISASPCLVGLDIEQHKPRNFTELVKSFATPTEQSLVRNSTEQHATFYRLWTAKEAFLKTSQCSLDLVRQKDLAICLQHNFGQVAGYHFLTGVLANSAYSYSVMTNADVLIKIQEFTLC